ncbi:MAG: hypothetical protein H0Z33_16375 [Bacillaceae bacterium]|nr:hypothetical protein [Bacillaceae bacterium]
MIPISKRRRRKTEDVRVAQLKKKVVKLEQELAMLKQKKSTPKKTGSFLKNLDINQITEILSLLQNPVVKDLINQLTKKKEPVKKRRRLF